MQRPTAHNARARQSVAGGSSRKKGKRKSAKTTPGEEQDSNATILASKSAEDKEADKAERLRQEVCLLCMHGLQFD